MFYASPFNQPIGDWDVSNVTNMQYMFLSSPFNQPIGDWELNNIAVNMTSFGTLLSSINYSKTLVGWANNIDRRNGPFGTIINLSATRRYDNTDYSLEYPGGRFANAVEARAYLIGTRSISVTGSTDSLANGVYNYVSETKTYDNPVSGFYFFKALTVWQLRDNANIVLDSSPGDSAEPYLAPQYTTVLATAVIRRLGAQWTITGDALL
jgi:surface protein